MTQGGESDNFRKRLGIGSGPTEPTGTLPDSELARASRSVESQWTPRIGVLRLLLLTTRAPLLDVPDPLRVASCSRSAVTQSMCTFLTTSIYDIVVITHKF